MLKTHDEWKMRCLERPSAIAKIPNGMRADEIYRAVLAKDGLALRYLPSELRTHEFCLIAVKQNGWALQSIPRDICTHDLCLEAVKQDDWALVYAPEELQANIKDALAEQAEGQTDTPAASA